MRAVNQLAWSSIKHSMKTITSHDLLLRNSILVVNKPKLLDSVTQSDQIFGHFIDELLSYQVLWVLYPLPRL